MRYEPLLLTFYIWINGDTVYVTQDYAASGDVDLSTCNMSPEPIVLTTMLCRLENHVQIVQIKQIDA